jgi:broad specificity phosphatase PhoE
MRHGQPKIDLDAMMTKRFSPKGVGKIVSDYEGVGINFSKTMPENSQKIIKSCKVVLSSDLPRALDSMKMLGLEKKGLTDKCFRESNLPYLNWNKPIFSFFTWAMIFRLAWLFGFSRNGESLKSAKNRAKIGAAKLHDLAHINGSVLLLGHGIMNRLVAKELKNKGWMKMENIGEKYWSYSVYEFTT